MTFAVWRITVGSRGSCVRKLVVFQAQGDEGPAVFCHKGPKGGEDHDQDPSMCSDILL